MTENAIDNEETAAYRDAPGGERTINDDVTRAGFTVGALGRIDKYELVRELGEGGFGAVYLARDTIAGIDVAIKGLPPEVKHNEGELEGIRANFALVKRLRHPNIVAVTDLHPAQLVAYASKEVESKLRVFTRDTMVVMDYAPGVTLAKWRKQFPGGTVPLDKALAVVRQIATALDFAHRQRVLHRDVKPANVMVETADDGRLTARVLDFGLAAEIRSSMGRVSREIRDTCGTRPYMAPEQWKGERQGAATDQYALAVLFYELVVGEVPFASVFDCGDPAVMRLAVTTDAPSIPAELPKCVRKALAVALAKKPEERFASCGDFVDALEGKGKVSRGGAEKRSGGAGKALGVLALLAALGTGGYYGWMKHEEALREKAAEVERIQAEKKETENRLLAESERIKREAEERLKAERKALEEREKKAAEERERLRAEAEASQQKSVAAETALAEQEARQKEVARLAELRVDISIKIEDAKEKMDGIAAYRGEPDGFAAHIDNADAKWKVASAVERKPASVAEAEALLLIASEAESAIARELRWLKTNKAARDGAKSVEAEIVRTIDPDIKKLNASYSDDASFPSYASALFSAGDRLRKEGNLALAQGDFTTAKSRLDSAKAELAKAVTEAKSFCVKMHLRGAKKYNENSKWEKCIAECEKALGWDAANAEAKQLKAAAEKNLAPSAEVKVLVDGRPLPDGEKVKIGSATWTTPIVWGSGNIKEGGTYGGEAEYTRGGKRYVGTLESFTVNWPGPRTLTVALKEYVGPKHGDRKTLNLPGGATMEMIYVGPGEFMMGSNNGDSDEKPVHKVRLTKGYWLGKYEVTQEQWQSVMGTNPSYFKGGNKPVERVSWKDCQEFIDKIQSEVRRQFGDYKASLPTEAQWEFACRAGTTDDYAGNLSSMAWYGDNSGREIHSVGTKNANAWGFHDMHGNVWEWCYDWYDSDYYSKCPVNDPCKTAPGDYRVLRGGGWHDDARNCRSANRIGINPAVGFSSFGFRLCCSAEGDANTAVLHQAVTSEYVVQQGDTLKSIANKFNVSLDDIRVANPKLKKDIIRIGQTLKIPNQLQSGSMMLDFVLPPDIKFCGGCGYELKSHRNCRECPKCGVPLVPKETEPADVNKTASSGGI